MGTEKRARQKAGRQARIEAAEAAQKKAASRGRFVQALVLVGLLVAVLAVVAFINRKDESTATTSGSSTTTPGGTTAPGATPAAFAYGTTDCPPVGGTAAPVLSFTAAPKQCIDPAKTYTATFDTSEGKIVVKLDTQRTPGTTNNFVFLARNHYYDGTKIFRTDTSIDILQGGAPHTNDPSDPGPGYTIPDEGGKFTYAPGQLVMARTAQPNSASAQFFLVAGPKASSLDAQGTYVVFGDTTEGLDVIKGILALNVDKAGGLGGAPSRPVTVNNVTITES